jgi:D-alanyl-D-alanine carboxypeptidase
MTMTRTLLCLGLGILVLGCTYDPPTRSAEWYENPEVYQDQRETHPQRAVFQAYLDAAVRDGLPGAVLLVRTPQGGLWVGASGYADLANDVPWKPSMIARVGSITKTFAAAIVLKLTEQHAVSLDARAKDWLPSKIASEIENASSASITQLLHQTSGIYDYLSAVPLFLEAAGSYDFEYHSKEELLEFAYGEPSEYRAGEGWNYSETNFLLLELVAERLSGTSGPALFDLLVTSELGLRSTFYEPSAPLPKGLVRGYADLFADERLIDVTETNLDRFHFDGGAISNVYDLAEFLDSLVLTDFLSDAARAELLDVVDTQGKSERGTDYYGSGLILEQHPTYGPVWGHSGTTSGVTAHVYHVERSGVTFAAIANASQKNLERRSYDWFSPLKNDKILRLVEEGR